MYREGDGREEDTSKRRKQLRYCEARRQNLRITTHAQQQDK